MNAKAIVVEGLGKQYRLGAAQKTHDTFQAALIDSLKAPFRRARSVLREQSAFLSDEKFWALQDIAFEVSPGEVVGLIGRNGAGKSTLLKVLSRITKPTAGRAVIYGRVGSLLEVGTGFHPELTGRENTYLNGTILGMKKHEIDRKFDEIVAFAEVEKFINTQVKHYSSGMYLRLAFSVAAHLEPEILLVDEVLAVGDAEFQKKCLGKMGEVAQAGRTILFVSHNMAAVQQLCSRALWIDGGQLQMDDETQAVIEAYLTASRAETTGKPGQADLRERSDRNGSGEARITAVRLMDAQGNISNIATRNQTLTIEFDVEGKIDGGFFFGAFIKSYDGVRIINLLSYDTPNMIMDGLQGSLTVRVSIPRLPLTVGSYWIDVRVMSAYRKPIDHVKDSLTFEVIDDPETSRPADTKNHRGFVIIENNWQIVSERESYHQLRSE
jgi:lipopolysaccharide transport system ATP-binding protein